VKKLLGFLQDGVMPRRCAFCGVLTQEREGVICKACREDLPRASGSVSISPLSCVLAPMAYDFPVDVALKAFKFRRRLFYGPAFGQLLRDACGALPDDIDALLPVPLHWRRQWFRGFNQAREIAIPVARQLDVPLVCSVVRRRSTSSQSGLTAAARARNLRAAFVAKERLSCRHVLVVDDVITTGATVRQVARTLLQAGAEKVSALAVARA
jgi:ComF family protein